MIYVIATLKIRPGTRDACIAAAQAAIEGTRKEEGCILYDLHASVTDPERLVFVEQWTDREALARHGKAPHLVAWRAKASEFVLERKIEVIAPEKVDVL